MSEEVFEIIGNPDEALKNTAVVAETITTFLRKNTRDPGSAMAVLAFACFAIDRACREPGATTEEAAENFKQAWIELARTLDDKTIPPSRN